MQNKGRNGELKDEGNEGKRERRGEENGEERGEEKEAKKEGEGGEEEEGVVERNAEDKDWIYECKGESEGNGEDQNDKSQENLPCETSREGKQESHPRMNSYTFDCNNANNNNDNNDNDRDENNDDNNHNYNTTGMITMTVSTGNIGADRSIVEKINKISLNTIMISEQQIK